MSCGVSPKTHLHTPYSNIAETYTVIGHFIQCEGNVVTCSGEYTQWVVYTDIHLYSTLRVKHNSGSCVHKLTNQCTFIYSWKWVFIAWANSWTNRPAQHHVTLNSSNLTLNIHDWKYGACTLLHLSPGQRVVSPVCVELIPFTRTHMHGTCMMPYNYMYRVKKRDAQIRKVLYANCESGRRAPFAKRALLPTPSGVPLVAPTRLVQEQSPVCTLYMQTATRISSTYGRSK